MFNTVPLTVVLGLISPTVAVLGFRLLVPYVVWVTMTLLANLMLPVRRSREILYLQHLCTYKSSHW